MERSEFLLDTEYRPKPFYQRAKKAFFWPFDFFKVGVIVLVFYLCYVCCAVQTRATIQGVKNPMKEKENATIEMLNDLLDIFYRSYTSMEPVEYLMFESATEYLVEIGKLEADALNDDNAAGTDVTFMDLPF